MFLEQVVNEMRSQGDRVDEQGSCRQHADALP
jgi:hypothetical protein